MFGLNFGEKIVSVTTSRADNFEYAPVDGFRNNLGQPTLGMAGEYNTIMFKLSPLILKHYCSLASLFLPVFRHFRIPII